MTYCVLTLPRVKTILGLILKANLNFSLERNSDSDSDNESGDPEKKKMQEKLSGILFITYLSRQNLMPET